MGTVFFTYFIIFRFGTGSRDNSQEKIKAYIPGPGMYE
jgi:hypothetical protein